MNQMLFPFDQRKDSSDFIDLTQSMNGSALAYIGDAVIELLVRTKLIQEGHRNPGKLNQEAIHYVRAHEQSEASKRILPLLSEEEINIYKKGRNSHTGGIPKNSTILEYRRATGLESLFGYLYLTGQTKRMQTLFYAAYTTPEKDPDSNCS